MLQSMRGGRMTEASAECVQDLRGFAKAAGTEQCEQAVDGQLGHQPEEDIGLKMLCKEAVPTLVCLILAH